jgi:hypothetical protein
MKGFQDKGRQAEQLPASVFLGAAALKALVSTSVELRRLTARRLFRLECLGCL